MGAGVSGDRPLKWGRNFPKSTQRKGIIFPIWGEADKIGSRRGQKTPSEPWIDSIKPNFESREALSSTLRCGGPRWFDLGCSGLLLGGGIPSRRARSWRSCRRDVRLTGSWTLYSVASPHHDRAGRGSASRLRWQLRGQVALQGMLSTSRGRFPSWVLGAAGLLSESDRELRLVGASLPGLRPGETAQLGAGTRVGPPRFSDFPILLNSFHGGRKFPCGMKGVSLLWVIQRQASYLRLLYGRLFSFPAAPGLPLRLLDQRRSPSLSQ
jgi:hypothetical protein